MKHSHVGLIILAIAALLEPPLAIAVWRITYRDQAGTQHVVIATSGRIDPDQIFRGRFE